MSAKRTVSVRRRLLRWISRAIVFLAMASGTLFCGWMLLFLFGGEVIGIPTEFATRYGNAELLYKGYGSYGSSEWGVKTYIYWTADSVEEVKRHYQRYFPSFTEEKSYTIDDDQVVWEHWFRSRSDLQVTGFTIDIAPADRGNLDDPLLTCFWYNEEGASHPCTILKERSPGGTLIFFHYAVFCG